MAEDAALQARVQDGMTAFAEQMLAGFARAFAVPASLIAAEYAACRRSDDLEHYLAWRRHDAFVHHNLHLARKLIDRHLHPPLIDELLRDHFALGRGQWG